MSSAVLDQVSPNKIDLVPPQSKEPLSTKKETIEASDVESNRNDDSNPQQGTGKNSGTPRTNESSVPQPATRVSAQRPSLLIPPTAKDDRKLFVGGLPADITDEEFSAFFAQFGNVMDSIVMFDYDTGRSRGFGFVTYEDPAVARHLLSLGHEHNKGPNPHLTGRIQLRDKLVEIKAAQPKEGRSRPQARGGRRNKVITEASVVPEAYPVSPDPMYAPYGAVYPGMPNYGFPLAGYGVPTYAPTPAGYFQGYMAPVFYPTSYEMAVPAPAGMVDHAGNPVAGYAFVPFAPPMAGPTAQDQN
uniref:RRM domain-containing protein n=1 Tax=Amphora coffeiformis TaxID=265554 RepID=A0A6S8JCJ1_9STRA|mmetsp:Transcript_17964/g.34218  ORF Transcript_17964/g.34218 Transcript_17964/m.34218 type:complete len:301 (-) Transcript_17964:161-1063(-)